MKTIRKKTIKAKINTKSQFHYGLIGHILLVITLLFTVVNTNVHASSQNKETNAISNATETTTSATTTTEQIPKSPVTIDDISLWTPAQGDKLEVNVETNMAQLIHENGDAVEFEIVSGVRRVVHYIGRRYFAATPAGTWVIHGSVVKKDRITFGKTGRFFRLYEVKTENGKQTEDSTPYGIHAFGKEKSMFNTTGRYGSMGCVIMHEEMLDIIQQTIDANDGSLEVTTFPDMPQK